MRTREPALLAWAAILGGAAVADVALIRAGHEPLSTVCRRSLFGRAVVVALAAHLVLRIKHDPLTALGRLIGGDA